jgi:hypothetical protein
MIKFFAVNICICKKCFEKKCVKLIRKQNATYIYCFHKEEKEKSGKQCEKEYKDSILESYLYGYSKRK